VNLKRFNGVFVGVPHHLTANTNSSHNGQKKAKAVPDQETKTKQKNNKTTAP
jgi:hypothetical protein